ncbi:hypothetical protein N7454_001132 [Penicillium verhagenii]|nr:hypothetical protein N7454_001132 [Penicillium verhagenii]
MTTKVFLTGATGYIGGDVFFAVNEAHPDWEVSVLVRSKEKADKLLAEYPKTRIVLADLDSVGIIEEETKNADIVFNCADDDHVVAATAIKRGATHHSPERPLWLIHTSGTGNLMVEDMRASTWGCERSKQFNDWEGVDELMNLPDDAVHRKVDKIIIEAGKGAPDRVKTAIICPPSIYGPGRGSGNQKSVQTYWYAEAVIKRKRGFLVGEGKNIWHHVHIQDLSDLYLRLGDAAAAGGGDATWNDKGYYLAENGCFVWGDFERAVTKSAYDQKLIPSCEVDALSDEQVTEVHSLGLRFWGANSRGQSYRGKKLLGWSPKQPSLFDYIPHIVDIEAKQLGLA